MSKARPLFELQELDSEIARKTEALESIVARLGKDEELSAAKNALSDSVRQLHELEKRLKTAEYEIEELGKKVRVEEKRLYEGSVKNPRELMNLQQEVDLLKEKNREREEEVLAIMMDVDEAQEQVGSKRDHTEHLEKQWQEEQNQLQSEKASLESGLADLKEKRGLLAGTIAEPDLRMYEGLRYAKQGLAVARVVQGRCQGCRISLPVSDQQKARSGHEIATCSNCGRILYMD